MNLRFVLAFTLLTSAVAGCSKGGLADTTPGAGDCDPSAPKFSCGGETCNSSCQVCSSFSTEAGPDGSSQAGEGCSPAPAACVGEVTCDCLEDEKAGCTSCSGSASHGVSCYTQEP